LKSILAYAALPLLNRKAYVHFMVAKNLGLHAANLAADSLVGMKFMPPKRLEKKYEH
jgi:hypothetical protein